MSPEELLADTNRVLHELLTFEREREEKSAKALAEFSDGFGILEKKRQETMERALVDRGLPADIAAIPEQEFEKRAEAVHRTSRENIKAMEAKSEQYRDAVLAELKLQSELLQKIAARLEG